MIWLAHSARKGRVAQTYSDHVLGVISRAKSNIERFVPFVTRTRGEIYLEIIEAAANYHDLGKLNALNQEVLRGERKAKILPVEHRDAGVAHLLGPEREHPASTLIYAHHFPGLPNLKQEKVKENPFRCLEAMADTSQSLERYLAIHHELTECSRKSVRSLPKRLSALDYRLLLSSLVDADYSDTSQITRSPLATRWSERLAKLDRYVSALGNSSSEPDSERNKLRQELYTCCRDRAVTSSLEYCDSPVGTGKTTAVIARALQVAKERKFRHIIVVLPFTNIITQTVEVLRDAVVLAHEDPLEIVAEHHHYVDFESIELRHLATTWTAPIIVTTAVQFFETLASNQPTKLRKLHQLPGSCIVIDESHAALPLSLMPLAWNWLQNLTGNYGCHVCLCSGTSYQFWEQPEFQERQSIEVTRIINESLAVKLENYEKRRIKLNAKHGKIPHFCSALELVSYLKKFTGPRLVVLNTVRGAANLAKVMRKRGEDVLHLSTALSPADRDKVIAEIKRRLADPAFNGEDWTLVATSCVECGLDFSFRNGFCELRSLQSYLQVGGRVNRNEEYEGSLLQLFTLRDDQIKSHPAFEVSQNVFRKLIEQDRLETSSVTNLVSEAFIMEHKLTGNLFNALSRAERQCNFVDVAEQFKLINEDTVTVVVDQNIVEKLLTGKRISQREVVRGSVNLRRTLLKELNVTDAEPRYLTGDQYDDFLGYMKNI